jgi:hypothetical protein
MGFRFSIKWLLLGTAYVAVAAAAFARGHWSYADILGAANFFAVTYALTLALFARGRRQVAAAGFAIASLLLLACLYLAPQAMPTSRLLAALPVQAPQNALAYPTPVATPPTIVSNTVTGTTVWPSAPAGSYGPYAPPPSYAASGTLVASFAGPPPIVPVIDAENLAVRTRAANAAAMMLAGLVGGILGMAAFRKAQTNAIADHSD